MPKQLSGTLSVITESVIVTLALLALKMPPPRDLAALLRTVHPLSPPEGLLGVVTAAVEEMTWLTPSDRAMVGLALEYARRIDEATDEKAVGWLGPHLANALRSLGGTPAERKALGIEETVRGKLAEIRAGRQR